MKAVEVEQLVKRYGEVEALSGVTFDVAVGEVFALLGPNGAGKTTAVEIMEGFRKRDGGRVSVLGFDPANRGTNRELRERMGVVLQEVAVEPLLSVRQVLSRNGGFYPNPKTVDDVLQQIGLEEKADARVKTLSGGQLRRLDLGLGIIGNPELLFLDEPTTGLDPSARRDAWDVVRGLAGRGTTVILTTHYMDEADTLADRLAVISKGQIVAEGTPRSIGGRDVAEAFIRFQLPPGVSVADLPVEGAEERDGILEVRTDDEVRVLHTLTGWALDRGHELVGLRVERLTLEDIYLRLTGYSGSGQAERAVDDREAVR
jgi:ABC-2 type transport system ATP-binding protein